MKFISLAFVSFLAYGMVSSESETESTDNETPGETNNNNGGPRPEYYMAVTIQEGPESNNSKRELKGPDPRCRWSWNKLHNEGSILRCSCLRCVCSKAHWLCDYNFKYCPYFYCGNKVFNPLSEVCCCGKVYAKKTGWSCCGYNYYTTKLQKCCSYSTIKDKGQTCPRYEI